MDGGFGGRVCGVGDGGLVSTRDVSYACMCIWGKGEMGREWDEFLDVRMNVCVLWCPKVNMGSICLLKCTFKVS